MKRITSTTHPAVKQVIRLHTSRERREARLFIAEGERLITTFLTHGWRPEVLYATEKGRATQLGKQYASQIHTIIVSDDVMRKMSAAVTPSGLLTLFRIPPEKSLHELAAPVVVLASIADPGNLGTLIRSAAAFGFSVVSIEGADCWSPKVVQASAGALAVCVPLQASWGDIVHYARGQGWRIHALVARNGKEPEQARLSITSVLVVGSEAQGIPEAWLSDCDAFITLPMTSTIESLNAAVAGSIGMYVTYQKIRESR